MFAIGLNKTGTSSLHRALLLLGYRSCHYMGDAFSDETSMLIDAGRPLPFDAYTDVQSVLDRYPELDRQHPTAAFILTTRDVDQWVASRVRHVVSNREQNRTAGRPVHSWTEIDEDAWRAERGAHHEAVLRHFEGRPERLLELDICGGDGWAPLCSFLRCSTPDVPFPHIDPLAVRPEPPA